jgi:molybdopterin-guanine dinucleotide biosynthesis protein B
MMPPIVSFVGRAKSGQTTLLEKIITGLNARGYSVATVKHTMHTVDPDSPGKDTWRHIKAGSEATTLISANNIILVRPIKETVKVDDIIRLYGEDFDIIFVEGFKQSPFPKIEVHRKTIGPILSNIKNIIAYASDELLETDLKQFSLDDIHGVTDFIENNYLQSSGIHTSIYVNDTLINPDVIPDATRNNILNTLTAHLKNIKTIKKLSLFIKQ